MKESFRNRLIRATCWLARWLACRRRSAEILARGRVDWLFIDMEQLQLDPPAAQLILQAVDQRIDCVLRVALNDEIWLKKRWIPARPGDDSTGQQRRRCPASGALLVNIRRSGAVWACGAPRVTAPGWQNTGRGQPPNGGDCAGGAHPGRSITWKRSSRGRRGCCARRPYDLSAAWTTWPGRAPAVHPPSSMCARSSGAGHAFKAFTTTQSGQGYIQEAIACGCERDTLMLAARQDMLASCANPPPAQ